MTGMTPGFVHACVVVLEERKGTARGLVGGDNFLLSYATPRRMQVVPGGGDNHTSCRG